MYRREINFYRSFAARVGVRTPVCYYSALDEATGLGVLLLEDLAPAAFGSREAGCTYDEEQSILETIASVHAHWHESAELRAMDWLETYSSRMLSERFSGSWRTLCSRVEFPESIIAIGDEISARPSLLDSLGEPPLTLIHRDYQLDNIPYLSDEDRYAVIDWQLVMRGRGVFDVANFLCWNLPIDNRKSWEKSLLQHYFSSLKSLGVGDYSFEMCERDYRLSFLECFARVVSIAGSDVVNNQPLWMRLEMILQRTVAAMMDLDLIQFLNTGDGFQDA
jgi:aminoglycoside/choline kinase family phosphotransferase